LRASKKYKFVSSGRGSGARKETIKICTDLYLLKEEMEVEKKPLN